METFYDALLIQQVNYQKEVEVGELSTFEISGKGNLVIKNTGGSSAAEGGMGDGGGTEKGAGIKSTDGESTKGTTGKDSDTWDPLKPKEEKEKDKE